MTVQQQKNLHVRSRRAQVEQFLARVAGPDAQLTDDARLRDLGLDSLDAVELVLELEQLTRTSISDSVLEAMVTVGDVMRLAACAAEPAGEPEP